MAEAIRITSEKYSSILVTQKGLSINYPWLRGLAEKGLFKPEPPVILSKLPESYKGKSKFHLYNGNTRFRIARDFELILQGLIVNSLDEIPISERVEDDTNELERMLKRGLISKLWPEGEPPGIHDASLEFLLNEAETMGF